jgi:hypothetical protein
MHFINLHTLLTKAGLLFIWKRYLLTQLNNHEVLKNLKKNIYVYFFIILFSGYYGSVIFFYHAHMINGEYIVHSHPAKTDSKGFPLHSHTSNGFLTIQILTAFMLVLSIARYCLKSYRAITLKISRANRSFFPDSSFSGSLHFRAPPPFML